VNWILKFLGYRDREYRASDYSVRIDSIFREVVSVIYKRQETTHNFSGERIGRKRRGIQPFISSELDAAQIPQIVLDLKTAFEVMEYGYVIVRKTAVEFVPEPQRQVAIAELREMGLEIETLPDGKIRQTARAGAPQVGIETLGARTPRVMTLLQTVHGRRQLIEILAKSAEFESVS
jgi:hypothetical protein